MLGCFVNATQIMEVGPAGLAGVVQGTPPLGSPYMGSGRGGCGGDWLETRQRDWPANSSITSLLLR